MALLALTSDPKLPKPRGRVAVNGWDECFVDGRSLASLRSEMLREKRPSSGSSNPPARQSKRSELPETSPRTQQHTHAAKDNASPANSPDDLQHLVENDSDTADQPREPPAQDEGHDSGAGHNRPTQEESTTVQPLSKPQLEEHRPSPAPAGGIAPPKPEMDTKVDAPLKSSEKMDIDSSHESGSPSILPQPQLEAEKKEKNDFEQQGPAAQKASDDLPADGSAVERSSHAELHPKSDGKTQSKIDTAAEQQKSESKAELNPKAETEGKLDPDLTVPSEKDVKMGVGIDSKDEVVEVSRKAFSRDKREYSEENCASLSPAKSDSKKRKRAENDDSSPSDGNTSSRQNQERSSRRRTEWNRSARKLEIPSVSELNTEGLDAETREAVAIAAQAEKDEANNRSRRTTRLAAGKIKQVDYKAAGNAQGLRGYSPSNEEDEAENIHSNDSNAEPARSNRRRVVQNQSMPPQRTSRRVARMRSSQEKDQSSVEEHELSSPGNGSEGPREADAGASQNDIDAELASGSRMNGSRSDGRDRKRVRCDGRKTRQQQADAVDLDGDERAYYGTRSGTRENSVADMGDEADDAASSDKMDTDEDGELEDDIEKRKDRHGWTALELEKIGKAVDVVRSTEHEKINNVLRSGERWDTGEITKSMVASYLSNAVYSIGQQKSELLQDQKKTEVTVDELRSFIGMDVWRVRTGGLSNEFSQKASSILARVDKDEKRKASLEKIRRKLQRETDDYRSKLDGELETRRKIELDAAYVELQVLEIAHFLPIEEGRRHRLEKVLEQYKSLDMRVRSELDKTKILVSQLRGERESQDELPAVEKNLTTSQSLADKPDDVENGNLPKGGTQPPPESITSGEDMKMTHKEEASLSQRQQEMERLRYLIADREAEAETFQRACEKERMKFANLLEAKNRMEVELYMSKSFGSHGPGISIGASTPTPLGAVAEKSKKDISRKGEVRSNGTASNRNVTQAKGKSNNSKHSISVSPTVTKAKASTSNNLKVVPGKNGETLKGIKKKSNGKPGSSPIEKQ